MPAPPQALGQREGAGDGPQRAVQAELADRGELAPLVAAVGSLTGGHQEGQGDGQVERRPSLRRSAGARLTVMRRDGNA